MTWKCLPKILSDNIKISFAWLNTRTQLCGVDFSCQVFPNADSISKMQSWSNPIISDQQTLADAKICD